MTFAERLEKIFQPLGGISRHGESLIVKRHLGVVGDVYLSAIKECGGINYNPIRMLHDCAAKASATFGTWTESNGAFDCDETAEGPTVLDKSLNFNLDTAATSLAAAARIYFAPTTTLDLRKFKVIGMWLKTATADAWVAGELVFELYGSGNTAYTGVGVTSENYKATDMPASNATVNVWEYFLIDISSFSPELLKNVTRIGFRHAAGGSDSDILYVSRIEAAVHSYGVLGTLGVNGLVRGPIEYAYVKPDAAAITSGDALVYVDEGYVEVAAANGDELYAGVAIESVDASADSTVYGGPRLIAMQVGGVVNRLSEGALTAGVHVEIDSATEVRPAADESGVGFPMHTSADNDVVPVLMTRGGNFHYAP